jgi:hypothetical protein
VYINRIIFFYSVAQMELNVFKLEGGNYEFDDSEIKQKYDNQKQLNNQLQEQKRWLEHELEEVRYLSLSLSFSLSLSLTHTPQTLSLTNSLTHPP